MSIPRSEILRRSGGENKNLTRAQRVLKMLIAIAIAEEIKGLHSSASFLRLWQDVSEKAEKLLAKVEENSEAQNLQNLPILCNPWISSAMAMAMSIYRTLCVLVIYPCISSILWSLKSVF